jgi:hypothetical protein
MPRWRPSLRFILDWIQYKTNFRDPVMVRRTTSAQGRPSARRDRDRSVGRPTRLGLPIALPGRSRVSMPGPESNVENHLYLDEFRPYRDCLIWSFNRLSGG